MASKTHFFVFFFLCSNLYLERIYGAPLVPKHLIANRIIILADTSKKARQPYDTVFLLREFTRGFYHAVFIEQDKKSERYQWLTDFNFDPWEKETYSEQKDRIIQKKHDSFTEHHIFDIPQHWLPLYKYKDSFYLYAPSEWGLTGKMQINSQEFIYWTLMGPIPVPLHAVQKMSGTEYNLRAADIFERDSVEIEIKIHIIDSASKMAIFEFSDKPVQYRYRLYIPSESADQFGLIVNYCIGGKQMEFPFEKIDFDTLLNRR